MEPIKSEPTPQSKARKSRRKPERRIKVLEHPTAGTGGWGALEITVGKQTDRYLVRFIPTDFGAGALGFELEKLDADLNPAEVYHVLLHGEHGRCDCKGGEHHGHCKHQDGLEALHRTGRLRPYRSAGDMKRNAPEELDRHLRSIGDEPFADEPPQLPPWADFDPRVEDIDPPDPAA